MRRMVRGSGWVFAGLFSLLLVLASASRIGVPKLYADEPGPIECPDGWEPGWQWLYVGISMSGGISHLDVRYFITGATIQPGTMTLVPHNNGQWFAAWYDLHPDPAESVIFREGNSVYKYLWHNNKALMRCAWYSNAFVLYPVITKGWVDKVNIGDESCDDPSVPGCDEGPGSGGVVPGSGPEGGPSRGVPEVEYKCDIYYEYELNTGLILYWTILGCYIA